MKIVAISRGSEELKRVLRIAKREDVVLRAPAGETALLSLIDDFDYEIGAQRQNKKLMAFLEERFRRARKEKGIPLEEVERRLGLPPRLQNQRAAKDGDSRPMKTIAVSRRLPAILTLLEEARAENIILKAPDDSEYSLTAIHDGDWVAASRRRSEAVMAYVDDLGKQGKLPPLEVVFVQNLRQGSAGKANVPKKRI